MSGFDIAVWTYLGLGLVVFIVEFARFDDRRKWWALPLPLLFIPLLWPWWLLVILFDRTRKRRGD